ncbi:MAG TPA: hypothetical protein ENF87_01540 [Thermoproteales archaeon]|nr:hypothetical protein [Thermoproteales archaeon]
MTLSTEMAIEVAKRHYDAIVKGDFNEWLKTLKEEYRSQANVRGSSIDFWWRTGRKMAELGVRYEFVRVDRIEEGYIKLFFKRIIGDNKQLGMPVPIHLVYENSEWKVIQPTY